MKTKKLFCFDLEGPICLNDNCRDIAKYLNIEAVFDCLDRYDDILYYKKKSCVGSTLRFIIPFFIAKQISMPEMKKISENSILAQNIKLAINKAKQKGEVCIISTSYQMHSKTIGQKIGIEKKNIFSTKLNLDVKLTKNDNYLIKKFIEKSNLLKEKKDNELTQYADDFFLSLSKPIQNLVENTIVVGGLKKKQKIQELINQNKIKQNDVVVIGDSIVDKEMLEFTGNIGGFSLCINAKKEAIDSADFALLSKNRKYLADLFEIFELYGIKGLIDLAKNKKQKNYVFTYLKDLQNNEKQKIILMHKEIRKI